MNFSLRARTTAEFLGTAFLLAAVVGSGIMGEQLAAGNVAIALLANTLATGAILIVLIITLGPISSAHFNPAVTLAMALARSLPWHEVPVYLAAQFSGAFVGVASAHLMFGMPMFFASVHPRHGVAQLWSEFVASFGLLLVIWSCTRFRPSRTAYAVGAYISCLLVYRVHLLRQSSRHAGSFRKQHVRRNSAGGRAAIRGGTTVRCSCGYDICPMAWWRGQQAPGPGKPTSGGVAIPVVSASLRLRSGRALRAVQAYFLASQD